LGAAKAPSWVPSARFAVTRQGHGAAAGGAGGWDGRVWGSTDQTVRVWGVETGPCVAVLEGHTSAVACLAVVNGDGRHTRRRQRSPRGAGPPIVHRGPCWCVVASSPFTLPRLPDLVDHPLPPTVGAGAPCRPRWDPPLPRGEPRPGARPSDRRHWRSPPAIASCHDAAQTRVNQSGGAGQRKPQPASTLRVEHAHGQNHHSTQCHARAA